MPSSSVKAAASYSRLLYYTPNHVDTIIIFSKKPYVGPEIFSATECQHFVFFSAKVCIRTKIGSLPKFTVDYSVSSASHVTLI